MAEICGGNAAEEWVHCATTTFCVVVVQDLKGLLAVVGTGRGRAAGDPLAERIDFQDVFVVEGIARGITRNFFVAVAVARLRLCARDDLHGQLLRPRLHHLVLDLDGVALVGAAAFGGAGHPCEAHRRNAPVGTLRRGRAVRGVADFEGPNVFGVGTGNVRERRAFRNDLHGQLLRPRLHHLVLDLDGVALVGAAAFGGAGHPCEAHRRNAPVGTLRRGRAVRGVADFEGPNVFGVCTGYGDRGLRLHILPVALGGVALRLDDDFEALAHLAVAVWLHCWVAADATRVVVAARAVVLDCVTQLHLFHLGQLRGALEFARRKILCRRHAKNVVGKLVVAVLINGDRIAGVDGKFLNLGAIPHCWVGDAPSDALRACPANICGCVRVAASVRDAMGLSGTLSSPAGEQAPSQTFPSRAFGGVSCN